MKLKIVERKTKNGISLFLETYWGYSKDKDGKIKHQREYQKLNLILFESPKNKDEKNSSTLKSYLI